MHLNGLARKVKVCGGTIEIAFMPYNTMKTQLVWQAMDGMVPSTNWNDAQSIFVMVFGTTASIAALEDEGKLPLEAQGLLHWWRNCSGDYLANYELFISLVDMDLVSELNIAWNSTRSELPQAPEILHDGKPDEDDDPNVSSVGVKSSKKKSPR